MGNSLLFESASLCHIVFKCDNISLRCTNVSIKHNGLIICNDHQENEFNPNHQSNENYRFLQLYSIKFKFCKSSIGRTILC